MDVTAWRYRRRPDGMPYLEPGSATIPDELAGMMRDLFRGAPPETVRQRIEEFERAEGYAL